MSDSEDSDDELALEEDLEAAPEVPEYHMDDSEVEFTEFAYSTRAPDDWVISGTLVEGRRGRYFPSWDRAEHWARAKYGARYRGRVRELAEHPDQLVWGFLIKGGN